MKVLNDVSEIVSSLIKVISGIGSSQIKEDVKIVLVTRLISGIDDILYDSILFENNDVEKSIDEALNKIEKLMAFVKENKHDDGIKSLGIDLQIVYDELLSDKTRLKLFKK